MMFSWGDVGGKGEICSDSGKKGENTPGHGLEQCIDPEQTPG